ncbi:MAG: retropepsin-like domain-containing protein [Halobacteriovoraceae bacterium]|nr:retropepsin-like domain-containing protein [Halobacteriovoraceae bacterium]
MNGIKSWLTIFSLIISTNTFGFVPGLLEHARVMVGLIEKARLCSLDFDENQGSVKLCTGLTLKKNDLKFLREMDLKSCKQFLKQMKYRLFEINLGDFPEKVPKKEVEHFFSSTKLALILHPERAILFKKEAKRGDCIHEVLHFYQRHRPSENPLNPIRRKEKERRLQFLLEKAVVEVEKVEKKGDKEKAKKMAAQLQPFISLQREWKKLIDWLDEKEIYQLFFDYPSLISLQTRDIDVALANLVRLKDSLPWKLRERVLFRANKALDQKYRKVKTPLVWSGKKDESFYAKLFEEGKISREDFENKVIFLRKYLAKADADVARREHDLLGELKAMTRLRSFSPYLPVDKSMKKVRFKATKVRNLPCLEILGKKFVLDTGANHSSMPPELLKKFKKKDVHLVGVRSIQSLYGKVEASPVVQFKTALMIGKQKVKNLTFSIVDLKIPGIDGVLGMDFFRMTNDGQWTLDLKEGTFGPLDPTKGVTHSFHLEQNGLANYDSLSYFCKNKMGKVKIRLDTGSQIFGDASSKADLMAFEKCFGKGLRSKLNIVKSGSLLFSKDVQINLGFPFLKDFHFLSLNLKQGEVFFTKRTH